MRWRLGWARYVVLLIDLRRHLLDPDLPPQLRKFFVAAATGFLPLAANVRASVERHGASEQKNPVSKRARREMGGARPQPPRIGSARS